jgi:hypothetical protein
MASDPLFDALTAGSAARSAQRVVSENHRYRWEQQWLQENNAVSGVVDNGAQTNFAADSEPQPNRDAAQHAARQAPTPPTAQPIAELATAVDNKTTASELFAAPARGALNGSLLAAPLSEPLAPRSLNAMKELSPSAATALAARQRSALKQFALWRSDDEIKISLRVADADRDSAQTIDALRQWFKELAGKFGLKLGTLIVNGQVRWQSKSKNTDGYY